LGQSKNDIIKKPKTVTVAPLKLEEYSLLETVYNKAYGNNSQGVAATGIVKAILHYCQQEFDNMKNVQKKNHTSKLVELTRQSGGRHISFETTEVETQALQLIEKLKISKRNMAAFSCALRKTAKKTLVTYDKSK
jgi:hypothetical protein